MNRIAYKHRGRSGWTTWYTLLFIVGLCGVASYGVDLGRAQIVKSQLRRAADAAARAGAAELPNGQSQAIAEAIRLALFTRVERSAVELDPQTDIEFGSWEMNHQTFKKMRSGSFPQVNAIRVIARRTEQRGNAVPTVFAKLFGRPSCDVTAESIATLLPPVNVNERILATANPFLAGMPSGTVASATNPMPVQGLPLIAGATITFDSIEGVARHDPNLPAVGPDGELSDIEHNSRTNGHAGNVASGYVNQNGIAAVRAPAGALVGVFLDDSQPDRSPAPHNLDFSTPASRDFVRLEPKLKQIFLIGDGKTTLGVPQQFIVPEGATRLYLATWDSDQWSNNAGWRTVKITRPQQIITVN